jgi:hypothetical protein
MGIEFFIQALGFGLAATGVGLVSFNRYVVGIILSSIGSIVVAIYGTMTHQWPMVAANILYFILFTSGLLNYYRKGRK